MIASIFFINFSSLSARGTGLGADYSITHASPVVRRRRWVYADNLLNSCSFGHISGRQAAEKISYPLDRLRDRLAAVGIGKPYIAFAERAKAGAGNRRYPRLFEELALQSAS